MVALPEQSLLEVVMRVREIVERTYYYWLVVLVLVYGALMILPLALIVLATFGIAGMKTIVCLCAAMAFSVSVLLIADPRPRVARAYAAAHEYAWPARMDTIANASDPQMPVRVLAQLRRAAELIQSNDAFAAIRSYSPAE